MTERRKPRRQWWLLRAVTLSCIALCGFAVTVGASPTNDEYDTCLACATAGQEVEFSFPEEVTAAAVTVLLRWENPGQDGKFPLLTGDGRMPACNPDFNECCVMAAGFDGECELGLVRTHIHKLSVPDDWTGTYCVCWKGLSSSPVEASPTQLSFPSVETDLAMRQRLILSCESWTEMAGMEARVIADDADAAGAFEVEFDSGSSDRYESTVWFRPRSARTFSARLVFYVTGPCGERVLAEVPVSGKGIEPQPVSTLVVFDRSMSMRETLGTPTKIEVAASAVSLYPSILARSTKLDSAGGTDDWFGLISFSGSPQTDVTLGQVDEALVAEVAEFSPAARGTTATGDALMSAFQEMRLAPVGSSHVVLLMTDGRQNTGARTTMKAITDFMPGLTGSPIHLHALGIGISDLDPDKKYKDWGMRTLNEALLASEGRLGFGPGGLLITDDIWFDRRYTIEKFFFEVFARAAGHEIALDPTTTHTLGFEDETLAEVPVASCDRSADFLIVGELLANPLTASLVCLEDPSGREASPGAVEGLGVQLKTQGEDALFRMSFPDPGLDNQHVGVWRIKLKGLPDTVDGLIEWANQVLGSFDWTGASGISGLHATHELFPNLALSLGPLKVDTNDESPNEVDASFDLRLAGVLLESLAQQGITLDLSGSIDLGGLIHRTDISIKTWQDALGELLARFPVAIAVMASVRSDYRLEAVISPRAAQSGETIHVSANTTQAFWPVTGATCSVMVRRPDGVYATLEAYDDGAHSDGEPNDGTYGCSFSDTTVPGYYEFLVVAVGQTREGDPVRREWRIGTYVR